MAPARERAETQPDGLDRPVADRLAEHVIDPRMGAKTRSGEHAIADHMRQRPQQPIIGVRIPPAPAGLQGRHAHLKIPDHRQYVSR